MENSNYFEPWKYLNDIFDVIEDVSDVSQIHCDTRDFFCKVLNGFKKEAKNHVLETYEKLAKDERYLILDNEVIPFLGYLEDISGGKGKWRLLDFKNIDTKSGWGMKYLRFYRVDDEHFFVQNNDNEPVEWRLLTKENIDEEQLENSFSRI